jgi:hypothetical protein
MLGSYTESAVDMLDFFERQREWSYETFGPPEIRGPVGPLKHLEKEAKEAYQEQDLEKRKEEIIDCLFLSFDAAHRAGMGYSEISRIAMAKLKKNKGRKWPDWRDAKPEEAVEHDRSGEAK